MTIPKTEYKETRSSITQLTISYVTFEMVRKAHTQREYELFLVWMHGKTCPIVGDEGVILTHDYENWPY